MARASLLPLSLLALSLLACTPQEKGAAAVKALPLDAQLTKAALARKNGQASEAVELMRAAAERDPSNPAVLSQLGYALIDAGQSEEAIAVFDQLIALNPGSAAAFNGKAVAFDHAGNHLAAQELYQHALALSPGSPSIRNNLAMSLILNGQVNQATPILEDLNASRQANEVMRQNLALAYGIKGEKAKALALNLKDLPPDEAKENMRFYAKYAAHTRKKSKLTGLTSHIGFAETPPEIAAAAPKETPAETVTEASKDERGTAGFDTLEYDFPAQSRR